MEKKTDTQIGTIMGGMVASQETKWQRWRRFSLENWIWHKLGKNWCGNNCPPLAETAYRIKSNHGTTEVIMFVDDAGEIGLGYPDSWHHIYNRRDFNKLVRWYVWQIVIHDWCGFRRWLWYKILFRKVNKRPPFRG